MFLGGCRNTSLSPCSISGRFFELFDNAVSIVFQQQRFATVLVGIGD